VLAVVPLARYSRRGVHVINPRHHLKPDRRRVESQCHHHSNNVKRPAAKPTMAPISPRSPELNQLVVEPRETLDAEVKEWLDLASNDHRALVAKEVIALANHGGGYLVIGFEERADGSFKPQVRARRL
jgi:hypothetical protein